MVMVEDIGWNWYDLHSKFMPLGRHDPTVRRHVIATFLSWVASKPPGSIHDKHAAQGIQVFLTLVITMSHELSLCLTFAFI